MRALPLLAITLGTALAWYRPLIVKAADCTATSPPNRTALVELYTSEGCSSCPPADRWLTQQSAQDWDSRQIVALAFHVDYWDRLGWTDRFAQPAFSARQRALAAQQGSRTVYTPSFLENVKTYKPFLELEEKAFDDGALNRKKKELMALSISIVTKCEPCMEWHLDQAMPAGAKDEEIYETIDVAIEMGGGQAGAYA